MCESRLIMENWKSNDSSQALSTLLNSDSRQKTDAEGDPIAARKVQKADREKLRRDRLNEHFLELGHVLDPDRPKNDKATILSDSIQVLKDLAAEVSRLKAEYESLSEESRELAQEKNELRDEKTSLKSDIDALSAQCQQRARVMFPWAPMDPASSVVMAPPYSYPVPVSVPPGSIPFHPTSQPFPYFGAQNPRAIPSPCSTFIPYMAPPVAASALPVEQQSPSLYTAAKNASSKQDSKDKICDGSNDVATELELKTPGSSPSQKDASCGDRKGKQSQRKGKTSTERSSSSRYSSQVVQNSPSNSVGDVPKS